LAAAQKLGLAVVPVVVLDHLTPDPAPGLVIADNRIAENAGWDDAMLRIEIWSLQDDDFDVSLTGFDADALAELMAGDEPDGEGQTDDDAVPEVARRRSRARAMSGCWAATVCCAATPPWLRATTGFSMASRWTWSSPTRRTT
jgi:ParB-like chromosome segregation protein Spo0J